jgi:hypothetical protein
MAMWCMCIACCAPKAIDIHRTICNTQCFPTATVFAQARRNVMVCAERLSCFTLCCSVSGPQCFKRSQCLHLQDQTAKENEATMLGPIHQPTQHYIPMT